MNIIKSLFKNKIRQLRFLAYGSYLLVILVSSSYFLVPSSFAAEDDPFLAGDGTETYDTDFAFSDPVVESGNADLSATPVSLNPGSDGANVAGFDISGIYLGMPFEDIYALFFKSKSLYEPRKKNSIIYTLHNDWKYNLDYECRQQNINAPEKLDNCIKSLARARGLLYASELHLVRASTGETIDIYFTSNATDNVVWRVVYKNDVNDLPGAAEKFENQRQKKILAFWQGVLDKYGAPNSGDDKWITVANAYEPMMTAYYGSLDLVNMGKFAADEAKNVQGARENFKSKPYAF